MFPHIIGKLTVPKSMIWEPSAFRFARPIRTIISLYGEKVIRFSIAGVKSSNFTYGLHTQTSKKIVIKSPESYISTLRNNCVIADPAERKTTLLKIIQSAAMQVKGEVLGMTAL